ncbi:hypothetical protein E2C01_053263 [Portunus trituberculatus]|uniref:Uncharacterized protein n=1 Tax=Portunus trituberculatus TaxID=210409 RepID=A0A5B7GPV5_PORTR|nr:hypothetical protein [Portunus trituberculatus]
MASVLHVPAKQHKAPSSRPHATPLIYLSQAERRRWYGGERCGKLAAFWESPQRDDGKISGFGFVIVAC